ncbi:MAG: hypothetical protein IKB84_01330, partial [Clostridia bacterium]|nr:hypothetical protein [Clostridia bacterium]
MSNENNNLQNEDTNERIDSEVISDISNCDDDDAPLSDEVGEEQEIAISPEESPQKKKRARERNISLKAYLFSTVAIILATLLLTYSICAEAFRAKYADNLVIQEQESTTAKVGIDLLNEYIDQYFYGEYDKSEMLAKALKAYVDATGDPYAEYYTLEELIELNNDGAARMCGIGVNVAYEDIDYNGETT